MGYTIDITNWKTNKIIFSYTCENNTYKKTLEEAVKQGVNLAYADLNNFYLREANLAYACLKNAHLAHACLKYADLSHADLSHSDLIKSNLSYANLCNTFLNGAYLGKAKLVGANMSESFIRGAILYEANLSFANLTNAELFDARLRGADLSNVILDNVKGLNDQCPKEGSFIGWKICIPLAGDYFTNNYYVVKLEILADAKRSSATTNKCRCSKAKVLEIQNLNGTKADIDEVCSIQDHSFKYKVGEIVEVPDFDERYWIQCASGIHFFMDRITAINHLIN